MTQVSNEMSIDIDSTTSVLTIESLNPNTLYKISFKIKWKKGCSTFLLLYLLEISIATLGLLTSKCAYFLSPWLLIFEMSGIFFLTLNDINIDLRSYARVIVFCFEAPSGVHFLNF